MFSRLNKFDGPISEGAYIQGGRGFIFGILIGLHIWVVHIRGGIYTGDFKVYF